MSDRWLKIALVISEHARMFWLRSRLRRKHAEWIGWKHIIEAYGYSYDIVTDSDLENASKLSSYSLIVLPEVSVMSDSAAENIIEFVKNGGTIIISSKWGPFWYPNGAERESSDGSPCYPSNFTKMMGIDSPPTGNIICGGIFTHIDATHPIYKHVSHSEAEIALSSRSIGKGFCVLADAIVVSKVSSDSIEVPAIITHNYGDGICVYFNFQIGGIVADYENDVCGEKAEEASVRALPRKNGCIDGECFVLKKMMKNTIDYALKWRYGLVVRVWQGIKAANSVVVLTHDVDTSYGWNIGISNLLLEEEKRGLVSTWYIQSDSKEYNIKSDKLFTLINKGHEIGLHGTESHNNVKELQNERDILESFCPDYKIESERQHNLRRIRLKDLNEEVFPTHLYESQSGFICSSTFPVYSKSKNKVVSGVKCYLPYHGVYWDSKRQRLSESSTIIVPITLQDNWIEENHLKDLKSYLKFQRAAKLWELALESYYNGKTLQKWIQIFDYCYEQNVLFCLLAHPQSRFELGTGSPSIARGIYGAFLDYILKEDRVSIFSASKYAKWWKAREELVKNFEVIIFPANKKIIVKITRVERFGITLLFELPTGSTFSSLKINGITWCPFIVEGNGVFVVLPQSDHSLSVEASYKHGHDGLMDNPHLKSKLCSDRPHHHPNFVDQRVSSQG